MNRDVITAVYLLTCNLEVRDNWENIKLLGANCILIMDLDVHRLEVIKIINNIGIEIKSLLEGTSRLNSVTSNEEKISNIIQDLI